MARQTLSSPDGKRTWTPVDATEETNLRARGWTTKAAAPKQQPKSDK